MFSPSPPTFRVLRPPPPAQRTAGTRKTGRRRRTPGCRVQSRAPTSRKTPVESLALRWGTGGRNLPLRGTVCKIKPINEWTKKTYSNLPCVSQGSPVHPSPRPVPQGIRGGLCQGFDLYVCSPWLALVLAIPPVLRHWRPPAHTPPEGAVCDASSEGRGGGLGMDWNKTFL